MMKVFSTLEHIGVHILSNRRQIPGFTLDGGKLETTKLKYGINFHKGASRHLAFSVPSTKQIQKIHIN